MKTLIRCAALSSFCTIAILAQPEINPDGVLNAASYIPAGLPNSGIAQGSMFVIFGKNLGPGQVRRVAGLPLPAELEGTSVRVSSGGVSRGAYLVYTYATQVAAVLPSTMPAGEATVTVSYAGRTSAPARFQIVKSAFGIFTRNQGGTGPAIVQNWTSPTTAPRVNSLLDASAPGQVEILWGTGLGPITGDDAAAPPVANLEVDVEVLVGGRSARLLYKGRSAEFPGLDQVNFEVPRGVEGCYVPVTVRTEKTYGNYATMAIASSGRYCSDPTSFSTADLERTEKQGGARVGVINLNRVNLMAAGFPDVFRFEEGRANFHRRDLNATLSALGPLEDWSTAPLLAVPGTCMVYSYRMDDNQGDFTPHDPVPQTGLKAGSVLNVAGPKGARQIPLRHPMATTFKTTLGGSAAGLPDYLDPGDYSVDNGGGGADVGGFRLSLRIPAGITWTNRDSIRGVQRANDLTVTWSAADPDRELVMIAGVSVRTDANVHASFLCAERANVGKFTVPAAVLASLPVSSPWSGMLTDPATGMLLVGAGRPESFTAPGIDMGIVAYSNATALMVPFQ